LSKELDLSAHRLSSRGMNVRFVGAPSSTAPILIGEELGHLLRKKGHDVIDGSCCLLVLCNVIYGFCTVFKVYKYGWIVVPCKGGITTFPIVRSFTCNVLRVIVVAAAATSPAALLRVTVYKTYEEFVDRVCCICCICF